FRSVPVGTSTLRGTTASSGRRAPTKTWCIGSIRAADEDRFAAKSHTRRGSMSRHVLVRPAISGKTQMEVVMRFRRTFLSGAIGFLAVALWLSGAAVQA